MARADLLVSLTGAVMASDQRRVRQIVEALIAEERGKQHNIAAGEHTRVLQTASSRNGNGPAPVGAQAGSLLNEVDPERELSDLVLPSSVVDACRPLAEETTHARPRGRQLLEGGRD